MDMVNELDKQKEKWMLCVLLPGILVEQVALEGCRVF
jgi:hypothetical protein